MTAPELKACPFCGEPVQMNDYTDKPAAAWVMIHRCTVIGPIKMERSSGGGLASAWNTRADPHDATKAQLAKAVEALREIAAAYDHNWLAGQVSRAVLAEIEKGAES